MTFSTNQLNLFIYVLQNTELNFHHKQKSLSAEGKEANRMETS